MTSGRPKLAMPLVSVVVNNFNYARFVRQALTSVAEQTYPKIEVIVVDDCSTDDSWSVINMTLAEDERLKAARAYRLEQNLGQTGACSYGLARSTGAFLVFLDADDILLPRAIETHVYAHLSMRINVGFSSIGMVILHQDEIIAGNGSPSAAAFVASGRGIVTKWVQPVDAIDDFWLCEGPPPLKPDEIHWLMPPYCDPWVWSSLSGHCFRREAVSVFLTGPLDGHKTGTDGFLVRPIAALFGSVLLDKALMAYRLHGNNAFVKRLPFARFRHYGDVQHKSIVAIQKLSIDFMIRNAKLIIQLSGPDAIFFEALWKQCEASPFVHHHGGVEYVKNVFGNSQDDLDDVGRAFVKFMESHNLEEQSSDDQTLELQESLPEPQQRIVGRINRLVRRLRTRGGRWI